MKSLITVLEPLSLWILFSLLAIAFVGTRPYLGLATAILGGILMGLSSVANYDTQYREVTNHGKEKSQDSNDNPWEWRAGQGTERTVKADERLAEVDHVTLDLAFLTFELPFGA